MLQPNLIIFCFFIPFSMWLCCHSKSIIDQSTSNNSDLSDEQWWVAVGTRKGSLCSKHWTIHSLHVIWTKHFSHVIVHLVLLTILDVVLPLMRNRHIVMNKLSKVSYLICRIAQMINAFFFMSIFWFLKCYKQTISRLVRQNFKAVFGRNCSHQYLLVDIQGVVSIPVL